MLYHWYELSHAAVKPARVAADSARLFFNNPFNPLTHTLVGRHAAAACEVFERTTRRYGRPGFGISTCKVDGAEVAVREEVVWGRPFCNVVRFVKDIPAARYAKEPRVLIAAPMSGHFASLLRGTVEALLPDHDVMITDWQDARDIPLVAGRFDLDDYIDYMRDIFRHLEGDVHVFAVCQPSVPVLAATAIMEADGEAAVPRSLTMAGGPIDTRVSPTVVNRLAEQRGIDWFRRNVITTVPWPNLGAGRPVYPGFLQLTGFMTMNLDRHVNAHKDLFYHLVQGDGDNAEKHRDFYDEYLAVMDLTAEFYLQTVDTVFVRHSLPKGEMTHRGRPVDLKAIHRVPILTIEGEEDDITGIGQCRAAVELCTNVPSAKRSHFECPSVGHYGIFNGSRFRSAIVPRLAMFMRANDPRGPKGGRTIEPMDIAPAPKSSGSADVTANAFTFAPANDDTKDPFSQRLKAEGVGSLAPGGSWLRDVLRISQLPMHAASLAGGLFLDQAIRLGETLSGRGGAT